MTSDTAQLRERVVQAIASQKQHTVTVLSSLLAVEEEVGYISQEAIEAVAQATGTTINDVWGVASFYTNFRFTPPGLHRVEVCWGTSCHVLGAPRVAQEILEALGLEKEGDTPDGKVSIRLNTCLGACSQGPVISIDHQLKGRLASGVAGQLVLRLIGASNPEAHA